MDAGFLRECDGGLFLSVKLQPRSSANQILEPLGEELRIKVTAPPVDSAANAALVEFLSKRLGCTRGSVELVRGHTSRHKVIRLHNIPAKQVLVKLKIES